jgi:hypothetical protein
MKFILRCLIVLAVAVAFGILLYYVVQALPGTPNLPAAQRPPQNGQSAPQNVPPRPERPENDRGRGIGIGSLVGVLGRILLFSVIVAVAVYGKNLLFGRRPTQKTPED